MSPEERLTAFLYLLARDQMTVGMVEQLISIVERVDGHAVFSSTAIEGASRDWARRLLAP